MEPDKVSFTVFENRDEPVRDRHFSLVDLSSRRWDASDYLVEFPIHIEVYQGSPFSGATIGHTTDSPANPILSFVAGKHPHDMFGFLSDFDELFPKDVLIEFASPIQVGSLQFKPADGVSFHGDIRW